MRLTVARSSAFLACVIGIVLLSGCAPALHKALSPADIDRIEQTNLRATISQEEASIYVIKSTTGDDIAAGGGLCCALIGSVVDKQVDATRSRRAEALVAPLLEQTSDVDYRKDYWEALLPTLKALPWLKLGETELAVSDEKVTGDWLQKNVMLIWSDYELTPDGRSLVIGSRVQFWNNPESKPSYFAVHLYVSEFMEAAEEPALATWSANGAELYRAALAEGIQETMRMIRLDVPDAELNSGHMSGSPARVKVPPLVGGGAMKIRGEILDRRADRIIFRAASGLLSLPIADIEIEEK